ncbi:MAG: serine/threonine protein kinase, partial [Myxococcales bacterium]|nr:serine/threonine protein kinase [Myxococcales bacterium]
LLYCVACGESLSSDTSSFGANGHDALLPKGTKLRNTYEVGLLLGEGGAGAVYRGRHVMLGHDIAIKVLFSDLARIPQIRERFIEEGRIQANLKHPNLLRVHDIVEEDKLVAIVMEYIEGETLHSFIQRHPEPAPLTKAVGIMLRLLSGLGVAHDEGIVHRDIKPGNVLLAHSSQGIIPKLCDFGIAKVESNRGMTVTGTKMGTLHYMAPEQFKDPRSVDARADLYSIGITFFELLTRHLPFDSDNEYALMRAHVDVRPPSPRGYRSSVPAGLEAIVLRLLEKKPDDRFPDTQAVIDALLDVPEFSQLREHLALPSVTDITVIPDKNLGAPQLESEGAPSRRSPQADRARHNPIRTHAQEPAPPPEPPQEPKSKPRKQRNRISIVVYSALALLVVGTGMALLAISGDKNGTEKRPETLPPEERDPGTSPLDPHPNLGSETLTVTENQCERLLDSGEYYLRNPLAEMDEDFALDLQEFQAACRRFLVDDASDPFDIVFADLRGASLGVL